MKETIAEITKNKCWYFEKINKIEKSLARLTNKKRRSLRLIKL